MDQRQRRIRALPAAPLAAAAAGAICLLLAIGTSPAADAASPWRAALPAAVTSPYTAAPSTTAAPTTTTTIAGIGDQFTPGPVTLPLQTKVSNGHVDPVFAWLSGIGFGLALLMVLGRLVITRSGGRDRAPLG